MAINGVEPATYIMPNDHDYFTNEQVREILIKFASKVEAFNEMEPPFVPDVDEFMEGGEK